MSVDEDARAKRLSQYDDKDLNEDERRIKAEYTSKGRAVSERYDEPQEIKQAIKSTPKEKWTSKTEKKGKSFIQNVKSGVQYAFGSGTRKEKVKKIYVDQRGREYTQVQTRNVRTRSRVASVLDGMGNMGVNGLDALNRNTGKPQGLNGLNSGISGNPLDAFNQFVPKQSKKKVKAVNPLDMFRF
jgi:hypothetical protein